MDNYEAWNHLLVELFKDILDIEEKAVITSEFKDITNNDMHIMEAVGKMCIRDRHSAGPV